MARLARLDAPGERFHVISRFVNREFRISSPGIRRVYLRYLKRALDATDWTQFAYAAMSSHLHHLTEQGLDRLEVLLRSTHSSFADFINSHDDRSGPVFEKRPSSILVRGRAFRETLAYIHNNPVRAGLVTHAAQSDWTSHRAYLRLAPRPPWLAIERGLELAGFEDTAAGRRSFHEFVVEESKRPRNSTRTAENSSRIRASLRRSMNAPIELDSPILEDDVIEYRVRVPEGSRANGRVERWEGSLEGIGEVAALVVGCEPDRVSVRKRAFVNRVAIRAACLGLGRTVTEVADALGIAQSTASAVMRDERAKGKVVSEAAAVASLLRAGGIRE